MARVYIEKLFFSFSFSFRLVLVFLKFKEFEHVRCGEHVGCCISSMGTGSDLTDPTGSRHVNRPFCMGKRENGPPNRCQILTPICRRGRGGPPRPRRTPQIATDPPHTPYRPVRPGERAGGGDEGSRGSTTTPGVLARGSFIIIIRDRLFPNSLVVQLSSLISRSFICGADSFRSRRRGAHAGVGAGRCRARGRRRVGTAD